MAALILLLAMLAFLLWAIAHTHRRINWYQDDVDAEAFLAQLRAAERHPATTRVEVATRDGEWITVAVRRAGEVVSYLGVPS